MSYNNDWEIRNLEQDKRNLERKISELNRYIDRLQMAGITYLVIRMKGEKKIHEIPIRSVRLIQNNTVLYYETVTQKINKGSMIPLAAIDAWVVKGTALHLVPGP